MRRRETDVRAATRVCLVVPPSWTARALIGKSRVFASGLARTAADPPQLAMGPDVTVNVASAGKMFTTIAVLQSLVRRHLSIDSRTSPSLPPDWVKGPGIGTITFRELLTHQAGFRLDSGRVFVAGNAAREQIRHGIQQADKQVADYNNINFTIFRDMLPFMEGARDQGPAASRFFISIIAGTIPVAVVTNSDLGATNPKLGENLTPVFETALFAATSYR